MARRKKGYAVVYYESDGCCDPKIVSRVFSERDDAVKAMVKLWKKGCKEAGMGSVSPDEDGNLRCTGEDDDGYGMCYLSDAYDDPHGEIKEYDGSEYKMKWIISEVPA